MLAGSLSLVQIVAQQDGHSFSGLVPHWNVFKPWGFAGFIIFLIASLAESNRSPFDIRRPNLKSSPANLTEYSGFKIRALLPGGIPRHVRCQRPRRHALPRWLARALGVFWTGVPSYLWFFIKLMGLVFLFIWIRGTLPALARGPVAQSRMEIHAADGAP